MITSDRSEPADEPDKTEDALERLKNDYDDEHKTDKSFWQAATMLLDDALIRLDPTIDQVLIQKIRDFHDTYTTTAFAHREVNADDINEVNTILDQTVDALRKTFSP